MEGKEGMGWWRGGGGEGDGGERVVGDPDRGWGEDGSGWVRGGSEGSGSRAKWHGGGRKGERFAQVCITAVFINQSECRIVIFDSTSLC